MRTLEISQTKSKTIATTKEEKEVDELYEVFYALERSIYHIAKEPKETLINRKHFFGLELPISSIRNSSTFFEKIHSLIKRKFHTNMKQSVFNDMDCFVFTLPKSKIKFYIIPHKKDIFFGTLLNQI